MSEYFPGVVDESVVEEGSEEIFALLDESVELDVSSLRVDEIARRRVDAAMWRMRGGGAAEIDVVAARDYAYELAEDARNMRRTLLLDEEFHV